MAPKKPEYHPIPEAAQKKNASKYLRRLLMTPDQRELEEERERDEQDQNLQSLKEDINLMSTLIPKEQDLLKVVREVSEGHKKALKKGAMLGLRLKNKRKKDSLPAGELGGSGDEDTHKAELESRPPRYLFHKDGQFWHIVFEGKKLPSIKNYMGLDYIVYLLGHPRKVVGAIELRAAVEGKPLNKDALKDMTTAELNQQGLTLRKAETDAEAIKKNIQYTYIKLSGLSDDGKELVSHLKTYLSLGTNLQYQPPEKFTWTIIS